MKKPTKGDLELRMYFLCMYNLSPIQQGIQAGHAQNEYTLKYWKDKTFQDWAHNWKTWIILNGGTSNEGRYGYPKGSMEGHYNYLLEVLDVKAECFLEPDLNNSMSAICFIVDEKIFNKEKYPDYIDSKGNLNYDIYDDYLTAIGGEHNHNVRQFLSQFRMA